MVSLPLAAAAGAPYLSLSEVNVWMAIFLVGVFVALFAGPFAIERRLRDRLPDADARWERALLAWGAVCAGVLGAGLLLGASAGFSGDSLAGSSGALLAIAAGLVEATLLVWMVSD